MKKIILLNLVICLFMPVLVLAQDNPAVTVEDIQICTSVADRQPVGADTSFTKDIGQLCCYTKLRSDKDTAAIFHAWYYNDKEMLKVELNIQAKTWRTWSAKKILNPLTGQWRVDVLSSEGTVLSSKQFTVKE